jgi:dephospho-CoA kinase
MILLGLTGGIGMGKSTSAEILAQRGVAVVDTDQLAREVVEPGQPALEEIRREFGPAVIDAAGRLQREELARRVFSDDAARRKLEAITHPRIRERWRARAAQWRAERRPLGVVVIPLLFETGAEKELDRIVCLACTAATQRERLRARGWNDAQIEGRIRAQWPTEKKIALAHFVIWSETTLELHAAQWERILARLGQAGV